MLLVRLNIFLYMPTILLVDQANTLSKRVDCLGNNILRYGVPFFNNPFFQIFKSYDLKSIMLPDFGFQYIPDSIITRTEARAVRWSKIWLQKFTSMLLQVSECNF